MNALAHITRFTLAGLVAVLVLPTAARAVPDSKGLVLWLDAADEATVTRDAAGRVSRWADKSPAANHAVQNDANMRPEYAPEGIGPRPALHFDGGALLNLGRPGSLAFRPKMPFTMAVVYRAERGDSGTFIAKGGGSAGQRAYQFYVTPNKLGAISYGAMREGPVERGADLAILVCDGSKSRAYARGGPVFSQTAGRAVSNCDVLVGARRKEPYNSGAYYMLRGRIAELVVYNRALGPKELNELGGYFNKKYQLEVGSLAVDSVEGLAAALDSPHAAARVDGLAESVMRFGDAAREPLESLLAKRPESAPMVADILLRAARKNQLADGPAEVAARLLSHDDPFVRGMAEWSLGMKLGLENNGQVARYQDGERKKGSGPFCPQGPSGASHKRVLTPFCSPGQKGPDPILPEWYKQYTALSQQAMVEADWARQAVSHNLHHDSGKLAASVDRMIERAELMLADFRRDGADKGTISLVERELAAIGAVRDKLTAGATAGLSSSAKQKPHTSTAGQPGSGTRRNRLWIQARRHMRRIALANPAVDFERVVCVKQFSPHTVRNITRSYAWKHKPGGDICILSDLAEGAKAEGVIRGRLGPGYVWGLDLWWDADRVVFGFARQTNWPPAVDTTSYAGEGTNVFKLRKVHEPLHVFEAGLDGSTIKQLTDDPYWSDFEPTYCADGRIVFSSDRCGRAAECGNTTYDHTNPNLYIMAADGSNVRHLTDNKDIDRYPHSLDDGRIAYTHWEYQERHFMEVHAIWAVRPDGTMSDTLFKHHMRAPCGLRDTRSVPGGSKLVSIATGHHTFAYGPVVVVDTSTGLNNEEGIRIVTPGVRPQEGSMAGTPVPEGGVPDRGGLYHTPWALSEKCFLVAYSYARPGCTQPGGVDSNGFGVYLIDSYGNRELIHRDPVCSTVFPMPLKARRRPPVLPELVKNPQPHATCYVTDVYDGMDGVARGTIKYIRVAQHVGWPFDQQRGQMDYIPGTAGGKHLAFSSWSPVRVIGEVPVESDGSASFTVPADTAVYFQALDGNHMEVVRMRSMVSFKQGEVRGCRGCHETQAKAPAAALAGATPLALTAPPCAPTPPPWGAQRLLGYEWLVQPVLDRHCLGCHGSEKPDGKVDLSSTRAADGLMQSYRTIMGLAPGATKPGRPLVACSNRFSDAGVSRPREFGSHQSPLVRVLLDDAVHKREVKLDPTEWLSLVTWIDANAPYHDAFLNKRPAQGGEPIRDVPPRPLPLQPLAAGQAD